MWRGGMNKYERADLLNFILNSMLPSGQKLAQMVNLFKDLESQYEADVEGYRKLIDPDAQIVSVYISPEELKEVAYKQIATPNTPK